MYNNKYCIEMKITTKGNTLFNDSEIEKLESIRNKHNTLFDSMKDTNTNNRKHISGIDTFLDGTLAFHLETEHPLNNLGRVGNALRFFSVVAADNGLELYVKNHRLMKSA